MFPNALPSSHRFELCIVAGTWACTAGEDLGPCTGGDPEGGHLHSSQALALVSLVLWFQSLRQSEPIPHGGPPGGSGVGLGTDTWHNPELPASCAVHSGLGPDRSASASGAENSQPHSQHPPRMAGKDAPAQNQPRAPHSQLRRVLCSEAERRTLGFRTEPTAGRTQRLSGCLQARADGGRAKKTQTTPQSKCLHGYPISATNII